jgi:GWxTD domain-containing protein
LLSRAQGQAEPPDDGTFLLLLSEDERTAYNNLGSEQERAAWRHRFWKERDPTPTTERNERLEEHLRRVAYARTFFKAPTRLGFDDRGRIYVKYGPPDDRYIDPAGNVTRGNESWVYYNFSGGLAFDFVEKNGIYRITTLYDALVAEGERFSWLEAVKRLYQARADLHPKYNRVLSELERLSTMVAGRDVRFDVQQLIERVEIDTRTDQLRAPPDLYVHDYGGEALPIVFNTANFRAADGKTRVEVYFAVSFRDLTFLPSEGQLKTTLLPVVAIFDHNYNLIARDSTTVTLTLDSPAQKKLKNFVNQFAFEIDPGQYLLFIRARNPESKRIGIYRVAVVAQNFDTDRLALSDIQFSHQIRPAEAGDKFVKNGLTVGPYPFRSVYRNQPISIYYEIYNLARDEEGKTAYTIDYEVTVVKRERSGIAAPVQSITDVFSGGVKERITSTVSRRGSDTNAVEYIGFDLSELPPATLELTVRVTDQVSGNQVSTTRRFRLLL